MSSTPLLSASSQEVEDSSGSHVASIKRDLFISHFLSTWNSRVFELGAVLYLASIFPGSLLPVSVYALARSSFAIFLSPVIGRHIDVANRLQVVRFSIVAQRLVISVSCVIFWLLYNEPPITRNATLGLLALLACIEKLCAIANLVAVERDWVVVIAGEDTQALRGLNSQMRRIDLTCKLAGPLFISLIEGVSTEKAILVTLAMNVASLPVEYYTIKRVYDTVPGLQRTTISGASSPSQGGWWQQLSTAVSTSFQDLDTYIHHRAFMPSFAGSLLYLTVLSFSGQMVTYLLSVGWTSAHIGIARTASVAFEISATWLAPEVMSRIGPIRAGIWFVSWQMTCLGLGAAVFWNAESRGMSAGGLVCGTILSRVGLWGFDLSTQVIVQEEVEATRRGSFSSMESSWQNAFELCSYAMTMVFFRPAQFRWPVLRNIFANEKETGKEFMGADAARLAMQKAEQTVRVYAWRKNNAPPIVVEFQDKFTWPHFVLNDDVLVDLELAPAKAIQLYRPSLGLWVKIKTGHVLDVNDNIPVLVKSMDVTACIDFSRHMETVLEAVKSPELRDAFRVKLRNEVNKNHTTLLEQMFMNSQIAMGMDTRKPLAKLPLSSHEPSPPLRPPPPPLIKAVDLLTEFYYKSRLSAPTDKFDKSSM
ncbi:hypothetical protein H0H81_006829 [Sphagnurus paluster]|uniref:Solute carrier family 40 member n=1 Tax=Sphagnurus paluster TaxID=117069 RepID=A0A9P7KKP8_9AGAR|nr:hypothetical protein H0H81_006829 [Sphagnurus paluster]